MKLSLLLVAALVPMTSQAAPLLSVRATCTQTATKRTNTQVSNFSATVELTSPRAGELVVSVGSVVVATVENVELQRSASGAQLMGTNLETVRLRDGGSFDSFKSARLNKDQLRLVHMAEYGESDRGRFPKRSSKTVVECDLEPGVAASDVANVVATVNR